MEAMNPVFGVARSGWKFVLPLGAAFLLALALGWGIVAAVLAVLTAYMAWFFRDPERKTPGIPNSICSPADGKVASVLEVPEPHIPGGKALRVAIFLNIFNVHVQRVPASGRVMSVEHRTGRHLNALNEKCSEENEACTMWLGTEHGPIGVRQIAGALARRIVCAAQEDSQLRRGQRYGIIQFGSRVELFLPPGASVKVKPGQTVTGGLTCIAVLQEEQVRKGQVSTPPLQREERPIAKAC